MRILPSDSFRSDDDVSQIPRGTPPEWLARWQLASSLQDPLEMSLGPTPPRFVAENDPTP